MENNQEKNGLVIFEQRQLKEFDAWEKKVDNLIVENPFIEVVDSASFKEAKKRRTALKSGRTEIEKQDKTLGSAFAEIRRRLKGKGADLIIKIKPSEVKQQEEIDKYQKHLDEKKEAERLAEEKRKSDHISAVETFKENVILLMKGMTYGSSIEVEKKISELFDKASERDFEEYQILFDKAVDEVDVLFKDKKEECLRVFNAQIEEKKRGQESKLNEMKAYILQRISNVSINQSNLPEELEDIMVSTLNSFEFGAYEEEYREFMKSSLISAEQKLQEAKEQKVKDDELQRLKDEEAKRDKEKAEKEAQEILDNIAKTVGLRIKQLVDLGFVHDEKSEWLCQMASINVGYKKGFLEDTNEEDWASEIEKINGLISSLKEVKERAKRLFSDKNSMVEYIENIHQSFESNKSFENPESVDLWKEIDADLHSFVVKITNKINSL